MLKRLLSAQLKVWHLALVAGLLMVIVAPTRSTADFLPSGTFNMATAQNGTAQTVHQADGEVEVLKVAFTVPSGQTADIAAFFNAEAYKYANGYCYLKFYLDRVGGSAFSPGKLWVADGYVYTGAYPTISAQGYKESVSAGKHTVRVALLVTGGDCYVKDRSLVVLSNRH